MKTITLYIKYSWDMKFRLLTLWGKSTVGCQFWYLVCYRRVSIALCVFSRYLSFLSCFFSYFVHASFIWPFYCALPGPVQFTVYFLQCSLFLFCVFFTGVRDAGWHLCFVSYLQERENATGTWLCIRKWIFWMKRTGMKGNPQQGIQTIKFNKFRNESCNDNI